MPEEDCTKPLVLKRASELLVSLKHCISTASSVAKQDEFLTLKEMKRFGTKPFKVRSTKNDQLLRNRGT